MRDDLSRNAGMPGRVGRRYVVSSVLLVLMLLGTGSGSRTAPRAASTPLLHVPVKRADLNVTLRAGGLVESARRTVIRCPLERLGGGQSATSILWLAPEGSIVNEGDVICRLDASEHQELERVQLIAVAAAAAEKRRAELDLDVSVAALREYREGLCGLERREFAAQISQARATLTQTSDRLDWSRRMLEKGYVSKALTSAQASARERIEFELAQLESRNRNYQNYGRPRTTRLLESRIKSAQSNVMYQSLRSQELNERLSRLQQQVNSSTIRAPHGGLLVYAHKPRRDLRIEEGIWVHQNQELLYLPDLSRLEVQVLLHETVVERVRPGMRARIRPEGGPGAIEGLISAIDPLPVVAGGRRSAGDVKSFVGHIPLAPRNAALRPGMTAEVEILTARQPGALVIPADAPRRESGRDVCYVLRPDGLERRTVVLGQSTEELVEVTGGLIEGEEVALPSTILPRLPSDSRAPGQQDEFARNGGPST
jgi:multidrug efflux pump subunit AcrA (membrane-fusion protein)